MTHAPLALVLLLATTSAIAAPPADVPPGATPAATSATDLDALARSKDAPPTLDQAPAATDQGDGATADTEADPTATPSEAAAGSHDNAAPEAAPVVAETVADAPDSPATPDQHAAAAPIDLDARARAKDAPPSLGAQAMTPAGDPPAGDAPASSADTSADALPAPTADVLPEAEAAEAASPSPPVKTDLPDAQTAADPTSAEAGEPTDLDALPEEVPASEPADDAREAPVADAEPAPVDAPSSNATDAGTDEAAGSDVAAPAAGDGSAPVDTPSSDATDTAAAATDVAPADASAATVPPVDEIDRQRGEVCRQHAQALLDAAERGDYATATGHFDATMRSALPTAKFKTAWESLAQFGKLEARGQSHPSKGQGYYVVTIPLIFEKANLYTRVACDSNGAIAGFYVRPLDTAQP